MLQCRVTKNKPPEITNYSLVLNCKIQFPPAESTVGMAKYDNLLSPTCRFCPELDTAEHRFLRCPAYAACRAAHPQACQLWADSPACLREHLLLPRNPHIQQLRTYLHQLPDWQHTYTATSNITETVHLFTDGSCTSPRYQPLALASWAVISATQRTQIAAGPLPGEAQCTWCGRRKATERTRLQEKEQPKGCPLEPVRLMAVA